MSKGVIFDMDGVLIDSYHAHFQSWQVLAREEGLTITQRQFAEQFGRTSRECIAIWWGDRYREGDFRALSERKEAAFRQILADEMPAMPGIHELLDALSRARFALAVGSSGPAENIQLVLDRLGRRETFAAVVTGDDVERGKPDPQVFLIAAARLKMPPSRCVVIEDAPAGIEAAHAGQMKAVGLASTGRRPEDLSSADLVVRSLTELNPQLLQQLLDGGATGARPE